MQHPNCAECGGKCGSLDSQSQMYGFANPFPDGRRIQHKTFRNLDRRAQPVL
jgi:hypothetical protein